MFTRRRPLAKESSPQAAKNSANEAWLLARIRHDDALEAARLRPHVERATARPHRAFASSSR